MTTIYKPFPLTFDLVSDSFPFEWERPANPIVQDATDEYSLPEHMNWRAKYLPRARLGIKGGMF